MEVTTVILSGLHSGTNPSPGLGIARSLRLAPSGFRLVGLDYSPNSSGLHSDLLQNRIILPTWDQVDVPTWAAQLNALLEEEGAVFISSLDLEVRLIAQELYDPQRFLSPGPGAIGWVTKPPVDVAARLGMETSRSFVYRHDDLEAAEFLRGCRGGVWVKGQHYEAFRAFDLAEALEAGKYIEALWGGPWHMESHVSGQEAGIAFVAREGLLTDCAHMRKTLLTAAGKTWSGEVQDVAPALRERLVSWVHESGWHGGGELEVIEGWDGRLTLMEINPRLPAWIHGATVTLRNLPLALLTGESQANRGRLAGFTRVIEEIPSHPEIGTPSFHWSSDEHMSASRKHPSGMPTIARRGLVRVQPDGSANVRSDRSKMSRQMSPPRSTPHLQIDPLVLRERLDAVRKSLSHEPSIFAYSVKTNPDELLLTEALRIGMCIEVISQDELERAVRVGALPDQLILNGPAKWWPTPTSVDCKAIFVDSLPEFSVLESLLAERVPVSTRYLGLRLSRTSMDSRFGIKVDRTRDLLDGALQLRAMVQRLGCGWGIHFHMAQNAIGFDQWVDDCSATLKGVDVLIDVMGGHPDIIDFGGGWHPSDVWRLPVAMERIVSSAPHWLSTDRLPWIFELGKSLVEPCGVLFTRVIVPANRSGDIVVDAGLADLPEAPFWPHPVNVLRGGVLSLLEPGSGRILGRTCMERDILSRNLSLERLEPGDVLVFEHAGGYDTSMAYQFGRGTHRDGQAG